MLLVKIVMFREFHYRSFKSEQFSREIKVRETGAAHQALW